MEHIPVRQHELPQEQGVVGHRGDVDGVRRRVSRVEVVRRPHHRRLLRAAPTQSNHQISMQSRNRRWRGGEGEASLPVEAVGVMAHAGDAAVVAEVAGDGGLEGLVVGAGEGDAAAVASAQRLDDVLHVHLNAVDAAGGQVGVQLVVEAVHLLGVDEAEAMDGEAVHDNVRLVAQHPRRLHRVRQRALVVLHPLHLRLHPAPVSGHCVPHVHIPAATACSDQNRHSLVLQLSHTCIENFF